MTVALLAETIAIRYFTSGLTLDNSRALFAGLTAASVAGMALCWILSVIWRRL